MTFSLGFFGVKKKNQKNASIAKVRCPINQSGPQRWKRWQEGGAAAHLGPPHEPQLEDVHVAAALQRLVPRVVGQVVVFVLLEEVAGVHLVAVLHQALRGGDQFTAVPVKA